MSSDVTVDYGVLIVSSIVDLLSNSPILVYIFSVRLQRRLRNTKKQVSGAKEDGSTPVRVAMR